MDQTAASMVETFNAKVGLGYLIGNRLFKSYLLILATIPIEASRGTEVGQGGWGNFKSLPRTCEKLHCKKRTISVHRYTQTDMQRDTQISILLFFYKDL